MVGATMLIKVVVTNEISFFSMVNLSRFLVTLSCAIEIVVYGHNILIAAFLLYKITITASKSRIFKPIRSVSEIQMEVMQDTRR